MATVGRANDDEDDTVSCYIKWPLEYMRETKEYLCGWCGQILKSHQNQTHDDLQRHFETCKNQKEHNHLMVLEEREKVSQTHEILNAAIGQMPNKKVDEIKPELAMAEILQLKTDSEREIWDLKSEMRNNLETEIKHRRASDAVLLNRFNNFEAGTKKTLREMSAVQETKMAGVDGRVSGVVETVTSVVRHMLEEKSKQVTSSVNAILSTELDRAKNETEALWVQLRNSEGDIRTVKTELEQMKPRDLQVLKKELEDEAPKQSAKKMKVFHVEPSPFQQLTIPMNCFNLIAHNYLFQPSFKWTIDDIQSITARKRFELSSEMFQWNGYQVRARANLRLKEDDCFYLSLCFGDENEPEDLKPIPRVFYVLKDVNLRSPKHMCVNMGYLFGSKFKYSFKFERSVCHKSWFNGVQYNVNDSVEIEIYVEPPLMAQQVHSYDGTLEWKIENYKKRLQLEKDNLMFFQESPYFYTGPSGYRVQVRISLNGVKGPTAHIMFWTGKFDAQLPKAFPHSTTVTLMNWKEPERSVTRTVVEDVSSRKEYTFEICKVERVKNLVENDTLFCKVVIKGRQKQTKVEIIEL